MKENPLRVEIKLRKGVMFPEKPGVMKSRELVAEDVVDSFNRLDKSPKKIPTYFDHVEKVEATDSTRVVFTLQELQRRMGLPLRLGLLLAASCPRRSSRPAPRQLEERQRHRPVHAHRLRPGQRGDASPRTRSTGTRRRSAARSYKLPFVDKIVYRTIKDEATFLTALRTGKLDVLEGIRWSAVEELKKNAPALQVGRAAWTTAAPSSRCASTPSPSTTSACGGR